MLVEMKPGKVVVAEIVCSYRRVIVVALAEVYYTVYMGICKTIMSLLERTIGTERKS